MTNCVREMCTDEDMRQAYCCRTKIQDQRKGLSHSVQQISLAHEKPSAIVRDEARAERKNIYLFLLLRMKQQYFGHDLTQIVPVDVDQLIEIAFFLRSKLHQSFPPNSDDLKLAKPLYLSNKVDHFAENNTDLMPSRQVICA